MKLKTKDIILVSLFAALSVVGAKVSIPIPPVPITLQLFVSCFAGILLGSRLGFLSQIVYILLGLIGIPVFAGVSSGPGIVLSPTFGYIIGFALSSYVVGYISERGKKLDFKKSLIAVFSGVFIIYLIGVPYLYLIIKLFMGKNISFMYAIQKGLLPFIIKDIILGIVVAMTATASMKALIKSGVYKN